MLQVPPTPQMKGILQKQSLSCTRSVQLPDLGASARIWPWMLSIMMWKLKSSQIHGPFPNVQCSFRLHQCFYGFLWQNRFQPCSLGWHGFRWTTRLRDALWCKVWPRSFLSPSAFSTWNGPKLQPATCWGTFCDLPVEFMDWGASTSVWSQLGRL